MPERFSINVAKENLKFSAAHFIAYPGFREPLHGHNYQVGVRVEGKLTSTGYVLDFGLIKKIAKEIVDRLDERTIIPARSDCLKIEGPSGGKVRVRYEQDEFILPASDVAMLPIVHSSAEELARYIWSEMTAALAARGALAEVIALDVSVAEGPGQTATFSDTIRHD
ncbi:MAG TPA: 6-carboxytetrahydropterin synthase [Candidatus Binataceae bacterium]|nr:6-carboxytetrahydropterin synthase [Candidatus Binataceae bacterium]